MTLERHQARILARIVDEIDEYRAGRRASSTLLNNIWGLITAAEVERTSEGERVGDLYFAASAADDARLISMPVEVRGTDADFEAALDRLRAWAAVLAAESGESG